MPQPNGPRKASPEELARQIARRLAEQGEPTKAGFSMRDSLLVGRVMSGMMVLATAGAMVLGIFAGVDWLLDRASAEAPEVLSGRIDGDATTSTFSEPSTTLQIGDLAGLLGVSPSTTALGPVASTVPGPAIGVALPSTTTTSTIAAGGSSTTVEPGTTNPPVTTTQPSTSSTSGGLPTTTSTSTTTPQPTIPSTTTTVTAPTTTTTTTIPTTTTTVVTTTTTIDETTTTCGNNGQGKGNC